MNFLEIAPPSPQAPISLSSLRARHHSIVATHGSFDPASSLLACELAAPSVADFVPQADANAAAMLDVFSTSSNNFFGGEREWGHNHLLGQRADGAPEMQGIDAAIALIAEAPLANGQRF